MTFSLRRISDGAGDCGLMSINIWEENGEIKFEHGEKPKLGAAVRVGSINGRSYSSQDYWTTTLVTEIIEDTNEFVRFKTKNSEYEWSHR